jgi:hypothetical protein
MGFRLSENDVNLLQKICKARGEDVSDFIRRSVRTELAKLNYLSNEEKKALGVTTTDAAGESNG